MLSQALLLSITKLFNSSEFIEKESSADLLVHVVDNKEQADLLVCKVRQRVEDSRNNGLWYFSRIETFKNKNLFFINRYKYRGYKKVLKIFYVNSQIKAGWRNPEKKYYMR